jgi:hypothetical protein
MTITSRVLLGASELARPRVFPILLLELLLIF